MKKTIILSFILFALVCSSGRVAGQGGKGTYQFLDLPNSARIGALGGNSLAINDNDITLTLANPSLINEKMNNQLGLSFVEYFTDINYGFAQYSRTFEKAGSFVGTMQFIDYGKFQEADEAGVQYGYFHAGEYALNIGWGRKLSPRWSIGSNLKLIYSSLESYNSFGIAVDVAGSYFSKDELFDASLIFRNIGFQVVTYREGNHEPLPFEIQACLSKELKHIPFRVSASFTHLEKWNVTYELKEDSLGYIISVPKKINSVDDFADNFMRHIVLGGEVMIAKVLSLRAAYNYQRRQEMKVPDKRFTVGFSWGFGIRVKQFQFSYARSAYHLVGSPNFVTLMVDLDGFGKK